VGERAAAGLAAAKDLFLFLPKQEVVKSFIVSPSTNCRNCTRNGNDNVRSRTSTCLLRRYCVVRQRIKEDSRLTGFGTDGTSVVLIDHLGPGWGGGRPSSIIVKDLD
ncbi:unnamed protein product, partial [Amoebophrya sp. A25]